MHVLATAGHVDHGKSTLVRALTGMEPDRFAEERRRGMTIDLGFAWTTIAAATGPEQIAFVDVPGHERFVPTMLAGVGPVPAAMFVVAADEGWRQQSEEHLAALHALGVAHAVLVVTRADLTDPGPAMHDALTRLTGTSLGADLRAVSVSAVTGDGVDRLREVLASTVSGFATPDPDAPVRLWVDRSFTIRGAGTVVTGTLRAGTVHVGDELVLAGGGRVHVRGLQALGEARQQLSGVARVALNLRGIDRGAVGRGDALLTPGRFLMTDVLDVRLHGDPVSSLPPAVTVHVGSAAVTGRVRPLGFDTLRLRLDRPLPLRLGDRALLRDPGRHHITGGATVLDVRPPALVRRGAAAARAVVLEGLDGTGDEAAELARRRLARRADLVAMGVPVERAPVAGDWVVDEAEWARLRARLTVLVRAHARERPLEPGAPLDALRRGLGLPDRSLVEALVAPPLVSRGGRVGEGGDAHRLPPRVEAGVRAVLGDLATAPFAAPDAGRLAQLGLGPRELAAAVRHGSLLAVADGVVLAPDAPASARTVLASLASPFSMSEARTALGTSRRVAVPLLELLDRLRLTDRLPDDRRTVRPS